MSAGVEEIGEIFWYTNWQATPKLSKEENIDITSAYFVYTLDGICMASPNLSTIALCEVIATARPTIIKSSV
jgi:hypothetical protein